MECKIKENKTVLVIEFNKTHPTIVNSFRRYILDDVTTFAIDEVEIEENSSVIFNEIIAHRLGLVPINSSQKDDYILLEDDKAGSIGSAKSIIKFTIDKKGEGYVYSNEIKFDNPKVNASIDKIPITKMFKETDSFKAKGRAILGKGRVHSKWAPAHTYLKEGSKDKYELIIESFGQLENKQVFNYAIDGIISEIEKIEEKLK